MPNAIWHDLDFRSGLHIRTLAEVCALRVLLCTCCRINDDDDDDCDDGGGGGGGECNTDICVLGMCPGPANIMALSFSRNC